MERNLTISKFRNIGLTKSEKIVLNHSIEKGKLGGFITIIGPNNAGKSNFLEALTIFKSEKFSNNDITNLSYETTDLVPYLSMAVMDGDDVYKYGFDYNNKKYISYPGKDNKYPILTETTLDELTKLRDSIVSNYGTVNEWRMLEDIISKWNNLSDEEKTDRVFNFVNHYKQVISSNSRHMNYVNTIGNYYPNSLFVKSLLSTTPNEKEELNKKFIEKYGYDFFPNIINYKETPITSKMLETNYNEVNNNTFFKSVLKAIEMDTDSIKNSYAQFQQTRSKGFLDKLSKQINKKLLKLTSRFNKLYYMEDVKYSFEIDLESEKIFFKMSRGEDPIVIDRQSTGFKWFFNLYFNFLCSYSLKPGDIVISDEFATSLHPEGQKELRKFIKEFGIKNDILFVVATQSPFLADVDNFDELRVVTLDNNYAKMNNSFTTVDHNDPDSLLPIKKSFTVENHVLYDYDTTIVYVEGITDYNYLTMFKNILGYANVAFLPIEGVGKNEEQRKTIIKRLLNIRKHNSVILVDGDKAGLAMVKACKETALDAISLNDIDSNFSEIENVFSQKDREKHNILTKSLGNSSLLKNYTTIDDFDELTLQNFKKIFDAIDNR